MYTQEELAQVARRLSKRWWVAVLPATVIILAAIALFIYGQVSRSGWIWMLTAGLTVLGGVYFLFFYGVYVRPMFLYRRHVDYMLNGRKRETLGILTDFSDDVSDKDGIDCHAMMVNIGQKGDPEDDRLFYYDAHKPRPDIALGTRVLVVSNDKMVADMQIA